MLECTSARTPDARPAAGRSGACGVGVLRRGAAEVWRSGLWRCGRGRARYALALGILRKDALRTVATARGWRSLAAGCTQDGVIDTACDSLGPVAHSDK